MLRLGQVIPGGGFALGIVFFYLSLSAIPLSSKMMRICRNSLPKICLCPM